MRWRTRAFRRWGEHARILLMNARRLLSLLVFLGLGTAGQPVMAKPHDYAWTALTHKATKSYRPQMRRTDAILALGAPAFAITQADENEVAQALGPKDVVLVWDNGDRCEPIFIGFRDNKSVGAKLGRDCAPGAATAMKAEWKTLSWVTARCIHPDRRSLCRPATGALARPTPNAKR